MNLSYWQVKEGSVNCGMTQATLNAGFQCPVPGCGQIKHEEVEVKYCTPERTKFILEELGRDRKCPKCGVKYGLTEAEERRLETKLKNGGLSSTGG
jgi:hypothetical protein